MTDNFGTLDQHSLKWELFLEKFEGFEDPEAALNKFLETIKEDAELRELSRPLLSAISTIINAGESSSEDHKNRVIEALSLISDKEKESEEQAILRVQEETERRTVFAELTDFLFDEFEIDEVTDFIGKKIDLVKFAEKINTFTENNGIDFKVSKGETPSSTNYPQFEEHLEQAKAQFYIVTSDVSFAVRLQTNQISLFFNRHNDDRGWLKL